MTADDSVAVGLPVEASEPIKTYSVNYTLPNGDVFIHLDKNKLWWMWQVPVKQWSKLNFIKYEQYNNKKYVQLRNEQGLVYLVPYDGGLWYYWGNVDGKGQWVAVDTTMPTVKYEE